MQSTVAISGKAAVSGNISMLTITVFFVLTTSNITHSRSEGVTKNVQMFSSFPNGSDCEYTTEVTIREPLSFDDLRALSSSPNQVREAFEKKLGKQPKGLALNNETYYDAVEPAITHEYGYYAYKDLGEYMFISDELSLPEEAVIGKKVAVNEGDTTAQISLSIRGEWAETKSYSSSVTAGLTITSEVTIKGIFRTGGSFSVSVTAGKSETTTSATSFESSVTVEVPPKSTVEVSMVGAIETEEVGFIIPIDVDGWFGANFENPVKEHRLWFMPVEEVLPKTTAEISGVIKHTRLFNTKTKIGEAVPI